MVYARYFKRRGKKYGPYYYTTERTKDGKVRSVYIGTKSPEKNYTTTSEKEISPPISTSTWVKSAVILALLLVLAVFALKYPVITGFISGQGAEGYSQQLNLTIEESQNYTWALESYPDNFYLQSIKLSGAIIGDGDVKVYIEDEQGNRFLILNDGYAKETGQLAQVTGRVVEQTGEQPAEQPQEPQLEEQPAEEPLPEQPPAEEPQTEPITEEPQENATEEPVSENITVPVQENITEVQNATEELPEENITTEVSNITEENITELPPEENITTPENITVENITINEYTFEDGCVDTCLLPTKEFNQTSYKLIFEISPNTTLELNSITYSYVGTNITNATYAFEVDIKDAQNQSVPATVEFVDSKTKEVKYSDEITEQEIEEIKVEKIAEEIKKEGVEEAQAEETPAIPSRQEAAPPAKGEETKPINLEVPEGSYDIKVEPQNHPIKEIEFKDIEIKENVTEFINIDDVPENATNMTGAVEIYAIDPTQFNFTEATVTATAKGNMLYKCADWNFTAQNCPQVCVEGGNETSCYENWTFMQAIIPGEEYTFTLTPEDPAYYETIQNMGLTNDSYVYESSSGTNYGTSTTLYVQSRSSSRDMRTFVMFNISDIPAQATIVSANLSLYKTGGTGSSTRTYNLYRVTASWTEAGITWSNQPAVSGTLTDSISVATGTNNVWRIWDATSDVQNFVNGTYSNYGWMIRDNSEGSSTQYASNFASEENANTTIRPKLDIYYTVPPTTPTNIICDGGSCNNSFYNNVTLNCSGSTAGNETITYVIDANYSASSTSTNSTDVSTSCRTDTYTSGQSNEFYSKWTIPGSGNVTLVGFDFYDYDGTLSSSENIQMALYADGGSYNRLSEILTIPGAGAVGWRSKNLTTPITITLGTSYWIAVGPSGSPSYSLARDAGADCSGYPPTGTGSYYQSASGGLDASVPTGASQSSNKYIIPGIVYTTSGTEKTWRTVGNHTNGSTYLWNISGIANQSDINLRCRAIDLAGSNTYSNYSAGNYNLTITSTPPPDTTPPAAVTGLNETSTGTTWIYWQWTNPSNPDFSQAIIYIDGSNILNTSNAYYNATGFSCNTSHNITINTKDTTGNVNTTNVTDPAVTATCPDATPPASVTNLASQSQGTTWIYWTWTNPADSDFSYTQVWIDGTNIANVSTPANYYNATSLTAAASHTIGTRTADTTGNVNATFVNNTAQTLAVSAGQNISVSSANGTAINATLEIINSTGQVVYLQTNTVYNFDLFAGNYTIIITPIGSPFVSVIFYNYTVDGSFVLPGVDEPAPAAGSLKEYAVNPLGQFQYAIMTVNLTADVITKCDNYTFTTQVCEEDNWATIASGLTPGTLYNITFVPGDPGFAEFNGTAETDDSYIRAGSANSNYGAGTDIRAGRSAALGVYRAIIKFNLSDIPSGVRIDNANLSLYMNNNADGAGARTHGVHKVQQSPARNWIELQVTWNRYTAANLWTTAGGDFAAAATATASVNAVGFYYWNVTSDVQNFTDDQTQNFGWIIKDETEAGTNRKYYASSDYVTIPARQPKLTVNWTDIQAPRWSNQSQNASVINNTDSIKLSAYWTDNVNLSYAVLSTNETGTWVNYTSAYGSPLKIGPSTGNWSNFTWSNSSVSGLISWRIWANDTQGNWNATDIMTFNVTIPDSTPPTVTALAPANNSLDGDGAVLFNCSATDNGTGLANISLYINSVFNQTNNVTGSSNSTTFSKTLANGNYSWYCRAADVAGNAANSTTFLLQVNTAAVPISTNYTGNTTNWASLPDLTNVCNGQAILEIPANGQIQWYGCVNVASQNFDTNVNISNNFISVNFGLNPTFNSSAHLIMRGLTWDSDPEILMDGVICDYVNVCQNITYDNTTGTLTFDTTHFTNFTTIGNARLVIWDQNDTGMPGGNLPACLGSQIKFFANYTRSLNGNPITGATCTLNFTDSTGNSMGYNGTSFFYEYNRTFSTPGLKTYNISCVKTTPPTRQRITLSDSVNITDCTPPQWSNNQSSYPAKYNASLPSIFNITWADNVNVSAVLIEGNWSGSPQNYSMNLISGTAANGVWNYSTAPLAAGTYYWKSYANDTSNNWNSTTSFTFTIGKADNPADLYLNGNKNQNVTITYPTQSNATGTALVGATSLSRDGSPVSNPEIATLAANTLGYNYTVSTAGNANYSANSTTYYLFVNKQPTAVDLYINGNLNQNVSITYGAQSNVTAIGTNGTVTLYENGSNLGNPRIATLAAGTYNYTAIIPDDTNRTGSSRTYFLTVSPAASQVQLLLDGNPANRTVEVGSTVNSTVIMITPSSGSVQLYRNGSLIQSGSAPITNISTFSTLGVYNMTAVYPATANYTTSTDTHYVITQDTTPPNVYLTSPGNNTAIASHTQSFVFNATDNYYTTLNCTLYINNIASGNNASVSVNTPTTITNTTIPEGNNNWYIGCVDGSANSNQSETRILTVDLTGPNITLVRPVQNQIVGYNVTLDADITDNLVGVDSARYEIRNTSGVQASGTLPGPAYQAVWNSQTVSDGNYTFIVYANDTLNNQANTSANFTVDNTAPFIQILKPLNNSLWNANFNLNITYQNTRLNITRYNITNSTGSLIQSNANNSVNSNYYVFSDLVNVAGLADDNYTLTAYAKDSVGYESAVQNIFIVDKTSPAYSNINEPTDPSIYSPAANYNFNITWTDLNGVDKVILVFDGTNYTVSQIGSVYYRTFGPLAVGQHNYTWYANDTVNNWNNTGAQTFTINQNTSACYLNFNPISPQIYGTAVNASCSCTNPEASASLYRNGVDVTISENNAYTVLAAQTHNYVCNVTSTQNYTFASTSSNYTITQATPILTLTASPSWNETYNTPTTINCTANTVEITSQLFKDGLNVSNPHTAILGVGAYNYSCNATATQNYTAPAPVSNILTITKLNTTTQLYLNGNRSNLTVTYPAQTNATAVTSINSVYLYRNGTNVTNPEIAVLGAGTYNYTAINQGDSNYTKSSETWWLTVNQNTSTCSLKFNPASPQNYTTAVNASCSCTNPEASASLYRNGVDVTISENNAYTVLAAQTHNYVCNVTSTQNYTAASNSSPYIINKSASAVNLLLNGFDANITVNQSQSVNITGQRVAGESVIELYENNLLINSGAPVITNITSYPNVGLVNLTVLYPETQNYTASYEAHFVNVIDSTPPVVNLEAPANNSIDTDGNVTFTYNVTDADSGIANCSLILNGAINQTNNSITEGITQSFTKTGLATANYTWSVNCTDNSVNANRGASETRKLIVDLGQGVSLTDPADQSTNRTINATYTIIVTNTGLETDNFTLSLNNIDSADVASLNQTQILNLGAGASAQVKLNVTDNNQVGAYRVNVTAQSSLDANVSDRIEIITTVRGILSAYVTAPTGTPKYYEGQNITFKGYVYDEFASPVNGMTVTFEPINGSYVYLCSSSLGEGSGIYNCTLDTTGMAAPRTYDVRINATNIYYNKATYTNTSIVFLESGQKANLDLQKVPSVQSVNSSQIVYNVTLYLTNGRGTSENTILTDPDANQTWNESTVFGAQRINESYLLAYNRGASDQLTTLQKANASGYDPFYNISLFVESNQPTIIIPQNITASQLTLIKNIIFLSQTTTNITYTIVDEIVNSGGRDLTGISVVDSDISLAAIVNLTRGQSATYSGNKTIVKNSQSYTYNFTQTSASVNSQFFYSNQPSVQIPGYGGPYDVVIVTLPSSVTANNPITGSVKVINQNTEISEDRTLTTWIEDSVGTILDLDVRTVFVGRNQSATFTITLTAPSATGTYYFVSELTWPTATANASKSFIVTTAAAPPAEEGAAAGAPVLPPTCGDRICERAELKGGEYECLKDCGYDCNNDSIKESWVPCEIIPLIEKKVPQDIINNLIELRNEYKALRTCTDELIDLIKGAESAAGAGGYDEARNLIVNAYALLSSEKCIIKIFIPKQVSYTFLGIVSLVTAGLIVSLMYYKKRELETLRFLKEEREHLEGVYNKVDEYMNKRK